MSYTKTEWKTGDIITAERMNKLEEGVSRLSEDILYLKQNTPSSESVLTIAQVNALNGMFKKCAFTSNATAEYEAFKIAFGITGGGTVEPEEPDNLEITLTSIFATYTGGDVTVGTALTDLTGITVTGTYSDGTTKTITGYTLSGTIAEGNNTITVSYGGKATTFTVVGIVESGGEAEPLYTFESVENATILSRYDNANQQSATMTISNGNHIKVTRDGGKLANDWFWEVNVSSFMTNGQAIPSSTFFTIPAGATVKLCVKNIIKENIQSARFFLGALEGTNAIHSIWSFITNKDSITGEFSFTAENEKNVPCATVGVLGLNKEDAFSIEFDVELYVNGVRWI